MVHAGDLKSLASGHVGSTPTSSTKFCRSDGTGRRTRLKISCSQGRVGSSPTFGTIQGSSSIGRAAGFEPAC